MVAVRPRRQERAAPVLIGGAQGVRAEGMKMVGKRARHEFHPGPRERPGNLAVIPPGVERNLAHGKGGGKGFRPLIHHRLKTETPRRFRRAAQPVVASSCNRCWSGPADQNRPGPTIHWFRPASLCQPAPRPRWRVRPVEPRHHQNAPQRVEQRGVGHAKTRIVQRPGQPHFLAAPRQERQFRIHRRAVSAAQFRRQLVQIRFHQLRIIQNAQRHAKT